ncbi:hypothetical protein CHS0354_034466, partial [Potamilus streckersoni]
MTRCVEHYPELYPKKVSPSMLALSSVQEVSTYGGARSKRPTLEGLSNSDRLLTNDKAPDCGYRALTILWRYKHTQIGAIAINKAWAKTYTQI